jgi:hypothetical protein
MHPVFHGISSGDVVNYNTSSVKARTFFRNFWQPLFIRASQRQIGQSEGVDGAIENSLAIDEVYARDWPDQSGVDCPHLK